MSDMYLTPTADGPEVEIDNGKLRVTSALEVAVYLSLFTPQSWGDMAQNTANRYTSRIPEIMRGRTVSNQTRVALIQAAIDALAWMTRDGVADEVQADAVIESARRIDLTVTISRPEGDTDFVYAVNWDAQEALLKEAR
jgi:phage gp46-like protein